MKFLDSDYPEIFINADKSSQKAQRTYLMLNIFFLITLIIFSFLLYNIELEVYRLLSILMLVCALILNFILYYFKYEKVWYEGRAVSESIKTLSWKYMMKSKPFNETIGEKNSEDELFLEYIHSMIGEKKTFYVLVGGKFSDINQITKKMLDIRALKYEERFNIYNVERLNSQIKWYSNNSRKNKENKNFIFALISLVILFTLVLIIFNIKWLVDFLNISSITTIIASILVYMKIKNFQDLTYSYSLTAQELSTIKEKRKNVNSEIDLDNYVDDAESAISREHTMWLARRDNMYLFRK